MWKKGEIISVYPSGCRGNHGCTGRALVRVIDVRRADAPHDWEVVGEIIEFEPCLDCGDYSHLQVGGIEVFEGWYDPEYYGHTGLQE